MTTENKKRKELSFGFPQMTHIPQLMVVIIIVDRLFLFHFRACRLVKGDGEIIEEIVSREQQKAINKV